MKGVELWLDNVAYAHSGSINTQQSYRHNLEAFTQFIGKSAEQILIEYEKADDKDFRRKYARFLKAWIGSLVKQSYTKGTIKVMVGAVRSFFKYSDLPLGYVPAGQDYVEYHNRDLKREEIALILGVSKPRDRAFYVFMAQSGLRPATICKLKLKHLEPDWSEGTIPCKVDVPRELAKGKYRSYFTFIGEEAVRHLKSYLKTRANLTHESPLFTLAGSEEHLTRRSMSSMFFRTARQLKKTGQLSFEEYVGKPAELRLYCLRKFFKKHTYQAGEEFNEFWMGHKGKGVIENYRTKDVEFHRELYAEKAMPFLRIEEKTPTETERTITELQKTMAEELKVRDDTIEELKEQLELRRLSSITLQGAIESLVMDQNEMLDEIWELKGGDKRDLDGIARFGETLRKRAERKLSQRKPKSP